VDPENPDRMRDHMGIDPAVRARYVALCSIHHCGDII
jgi:hypothetical protein